MKLFKLLFNRVIFVSLAIILQIAVYVLLVMELLNYWWFFVLSAIISTVIFLRVNVKNSNPAIKILWVCVILLLPLLGFVLYVMLGESRWTKRQKKKMRRILERQIEEFSPAQSLPEKYAGQIKFLKTTAKTCAYSSCRTKYFPTGEEYFADLKEKLALAEKFIFMEFFIIEQGEMWNAILEILERKVAEGVEVRVMYDDIGCVMKLPSNYFKKLRKRGLKCLRFNKYLPFVTNLHNNRDHRKIVIIDGKVGYTGGINLADEYINRAGNSFYWKDTAVRIEGNAVNELTEMFLQLWGITESVFEKRNYEFSSYAYSNPLHSEDGIVVPFGSGPSFFYDVPVAEEAFLNMIANAQREIIITTPYLIIDYSLKRALSSAVARGVDVKVVIPDVPDKKIIYLMTKVNAEYLAGQGVKIYRATGSFLHAKSILADGEAAIVGTINFDYRSLLHHFENGVWMYNTCAVSGLKKDVDELTSDENYFGDKLKVKGIARLFASLLEIFTPLF